MKCDLAGGTCNDFWIRWLTTWTKMLLRARYQLMCGCRWRGGCTSSLPPPGPLCCFACLCASRPASLDTPAVWPTRSEITMRWKSLGLGYSFSQVISDSSMSPWRAQLLRYEDFHPSLLVLWTTMALRSCTGYAFISSTDTKFLSPYITWFEYSSTSYWTQTVMYKY